MSTHLKKQLFVFSNIFGYLVMLVINGLANALPINGKTTGGIADSFPNLFVPAGITFAIWGVIYLLLAMLLIFQLYSLFRREIASTLFLVKIGWWFLITCLLNVSWILAWHFELIWLSLFIMLMMLGSLIIIYNRLDIGGCCSKMNEKVFVFVPFSLYLGWISIATIANITAFLVDVGWNGFGFSDVFWAVTVIIVGVAIALVILFKNRDIVYSLAVAWALFGIILKRLESGIDQERIIIYTALAGLVFILGSTLVQILQRKFYH